ncbi:MAG: Subunit of the glycosylphosphatidylinositol transamidase complex-like protein [Bathelium mastoideum]|nr:MAG: Subunit of the glycosylphosphatidylinositol transamidase complex-like protein [Bathelium mastoideum]
MAMFHLLYFFLTFFSCCVHAASNYQERLLLRPLPQSALLASFNFRSNASSTSFEQQHFRYFPRSLGQILQHAHTKELHLRFSLGRWDDENWGQRPWSGTREGGTGVELWAWLEANTDEELVLKKLCGVAMKVDITLRANSRWLTLTNALSGLFCASLNFIDSTKTIRPAMTFEVEGKYTAEARKKLHLLHGSLPHEVVCTENLTPFLKLLPCKGKAGISSLLDGHKLFDATWQTMAIDVRPICTQENADCTLEMEQTVDMVLDTERSARPRDNPIPRPPPIQDIECDTSKSYSADDTCYPVVKDTESAWALTGIFGRPIRGACPLADSNQEQPFAPICINVPPERVVGISSEASFVEQRHDDGYMRCYEPTAGADFDLKLPEQMLSAKSPLQQPRMYASRSFTGNGQERGGVRAVITNTSPEYVSLSYLESLPWFMKVYLHTLRTSIKSPSLTASRREDHVDQPIQDIYYRPAVDRHRGTHLELLLTIPPLSSLILTYDFEKAILRYTEYPPDANRGFDVAPAVIRLLPGSNSSFHDGSAYLRTTSLLLPLPTPDFSMPYNVIILTSTVMALGFGSIFNLLVRRFVAVDEVPMLASGGLGSKVLGQLERVKILLRGKATIGKEE